MFSSELPRPRDSRPQPPHPQNRRVVVTGMGVVSPVGSSVATFWDSLLTGRSGIAPITLFDASNYPCPYAAEVKDFDPTSVVEPKRVPTFSRPTLFGLGAALQCVANAEWHSRPGDGVCGVVGGTANTAQGAVEEAILLAEKHGFRATRQLWYTLTKAFPHAMASEVGRRTGFQAKALTISTACTAGLNAVDQSMRLIRRGECDCVLTPAADATITENLYPYFCRAGMLATSDLPPNRISRPFDAQRSGGILGEGGACLLLEDLAHARRRQAPILCEVLGAGSCGEGYSADNEDAFVGGVVRALEEALADASLSPATIDYVGCHGVSDPTLDRLETLSLKRVFGEEGAYRIPMSSIKALTGMPLSVGGLLQTIATTQAIQNDLLPPTHNYENPDPECDLDWVPNTPRRNRIGRALIWGHGFNGSDSAIVIGAVRQP